MNDAHPTDDSARPLGWALRTLPALGVVALAGLAVFYGIGGGAGKVADDPACQPAVAAAARLKPLMRGELARLTPVASGLKLPDLAFQDGAGAEKRLADFRGKWLVLNLWATWCAPCRVEMPSLARLEDQLGGERFTVLAIDVEAGNAERARQFLKEVGASGLGFYGDPTGRVLQELRGVGLPTTLLVDPNGCEVAHLLGPADWAGAEAKALIAAAIEGGR